MSNPDQKLYQHTPHPHKPRNVNHVHREEHKAASINRKIAVWLTRAVGSMICAYLFLMLALIGFPGFLGSTTAIYVQWISQTCIQLVMLSVIMVGQGVIGRKAELQSDEMFETSKHSFHDIEQIIKHLDKQDEAILAILAKLEEKKTVVRRMEKK